MLLMVVRGGGDESTQRVRPSCITTSLRGKHRADRTFVQSGAADVGILALSLAVAPQMRDAGRFWQVPLDAYPRIEQGGIILKSSKNLESARAFRNFVLGDHGREALKLYGFSVPEK
jgi:ABC-type molybdate transport system substrate-binding protein